MASQIITGHFSCDNCYAVYLGDQNGVLTKLLPTGTANGVYNTLASQIFNGEDILPFTAYTGDWFYIIAWSDDAQKQGLIGEFIGTQTIFSGNSAWEVFPTKQNYNNQQAPDAAEINSFITAANNSSAWVAPAVGPINLNSDIIYTSSPNIKVNNVDDNANWMWHDSGNDTSAGKPFEGFNHDEFLIFRIPVWAMAPALDPALDSHDCDCNGCNKDSKAQNEELIERAKAKFYTQKAGLECGRPFGKECEKQVITDKINLQPCFYFNWGDGAKDQIEEHDTEVFYITVCNQYRDIRYKGLRITKVTLVPNTHSIDKIHIVPDRFVNFDCLEPCSCQTREFAMITRANDTAGNYKLEVEYCFEGIEFAGRLATNGKVEFDLEITED
jgi:hypothetical protein